MKAIIYNLIKANHKPFLYVTFLLYFLNCSIMLSGQEVCDINTQLGYNIGTDYDDVAYEILEQDDGKFVVWGRSYVPGNSFRITGFRVFSNGVLDPSFGVQGKVSKTFSQRNTVTCAELQDDGKFLVAGYQSTTNGVSQFKAYVARFNEDGSVDTSFGVDGVSIIPILNGDCEVKGMRYFSDGKIQVMGKHNTGVFVARLESDGQLDQGYLSQGYAQYSSPVSSFTDRPSATVLEDGTCIFAGKQSISSINRLSIIKVLPDGTLDTSFGVGGTAVEMSLPLFGVSNNIRCEEAYDGNYLVTALTTGYITFILKIDALTGALVPSFGTGGVANLPALTEPFSYFDVHKILKDEANGNYLLIGGKSDPITIRMDANGGIINECGNPLNINQMGFTNNQTYNCGLIDQNGEVRLAGTTGVVDETNSTIDQGASNFMWPYNDEPQDPQILGVAPEVIQVDSPVEISVFGYGLATAGQVLLNGIGFETIMAESIEIIDDQHITAIINPQDAALGIRDINVIIGSTTLTLQDAITIADDNNFDGCVNFISRTALRVGANQQFAVTYRNKSSITLIATPLVVLSNGAYDLSLSTTYDYTQDIEMNDMVSYFASNGINTDLLNSSIVDESYNRTINAMITMDLAPGEGDVVTGTQRLLTNAATSRVTANFNPNPFVDPSGLLTTYVPEPVICSLESTLEAIEATFPSLDPTNFESCFSPSYAAMQSQLAFIARDNQHTAIPYNPYIFKFIYEAMQCIDPTYNITQQEFVDFAIAMVTYRANNYIVNDGSLCADYGNASQNNFPPPGTEPETNTCATVFPGFITFCVDLGNNTIINVTECQYEDLLTYFGTVSIVPCEDYEEDEVDDWTEEEGAEPELPEDPETGDGNPNCSESSGYNNALCAQTPEGFVIRMNLCQFSVVDDSYNNQLALVSCDDNDPDVDLTEGDLYEDCIENNGVGAETMCFVMPNGNTVSETSCSYYELIELMPEIAPGGDYEWIPTNCDDDSPDPNDPNDPDSDPNDQPDPDDDHLDACDECEDEIDVFGQASQDPNEKIGPTSAHGGTYVNDHSMFYAIHFENVDTAEIAASRVLVVDTLDTDLLDISTFNFTYASWGNDIIATHEDETLVDLRPEMPHFLRITTALDESNGVATWLFETLDTLSLMPAEGLDEGFLPPNVNSPEGMGYVSFEIELGSDIEPDTEINNQGHIYFDYNEVITTNIWSNIYDPIAPESEVSTDIGYTPGTVVAEISWGSDDDDVLYYDIYFNEDASDEWLLWKNNITHTSALFQGDLGHTFYFMSVAIDSAMNVEEYPDTYDAFVFMGTVSVDEIDEDNNAIKIYPNPATEQAIITVEDIEFSEIVLLDMTGRIVKTISNKDRVKQYMLSLTEFSAGIYNVQLLDENRNSLGVNRLVVY